MSILPPIRVTYNYHFSNKTFIFRGGSHYKFPIFKALWRASVIRIENVEHGNNIYDNGKLSPGTLIFDAYVSDAPRGFLLESSAGDTFGITIEDYSDDDSPLGIGVLCDQPSQGSLTSRTSYTDLPPTW